jgi:hypothetical protein
MRLMTLRLTTLGRAALLGLLVLAWAAGPARAQEAGQPVMENVFFNVVWGSAFGATLGAAVAVIGSDDKSAPEDVRSAVFSGATAGGLIGLGVALYLVYQGITFDPNTSSFADAQGRPLPPAAFHDALPPFTLVTAPEQPGRVTGFTARVFHMKF